MSCDHSATEYLGSMGNERGPKALEVRPTTERRVRALQTNSTRKELGWFIAGVIAGVALAIGIAARYPIDYFSRVILVLL